MMLDTEQNVIFSSFLAFLSSRTLRRVPEGSRQEQGPPCILWRSCCPKSPGSSARGVGDPLRNAALPAAPRAEGTGRGCWEPVPSRERGTRPHTPRGQGKWQPRYRRDVTMAGVAEAENHTELVVTPLLGWIKETAFIEQSWVDTSEA